MEFPSLSKHQYLLAAVEWLVVANPKVNSFTIAVHKQRALFCILRLECNVKRIKVITLAQEVSFHQCYVPRLLVFEIFHRFENINRKKKFHHLLSKEKYVCIRNDTVEIKEFLLMLEFLLGHFICRILSVEYQSNSMTDLFWKLCSSDMLSIYILFVSSIHYTTRQLLKLLNSVRLF